MNSFSVIFDWKFVAALGGAAGFVIFALKISPDAAERVLTHAVDACGGHAIAGNGNR